MMGLGITVVGAMTDFKRSRRRPFLKTSAAKRPA
jgi:hypothetical protein